MRTRAQRRHKTEVIAKNRSAFFLKHCNGGEWHKVIGRFRKWNGSCSCSMCRSARKHDTSKKDTMKSKYFHDSTAAAVEIRTFSYLSP